jgi:hypothetical protein
VVSAYTMFVRSQGTHRCPLRAPSSFLCAIAAHCSATTVVESRRRMDSCLWPYPDARKGPQCSPSCALRACAVALPHHTM